QGIKEYDAVYLPNLRKRKFDFIAAGRNRKSNKKRSQEEVYEALEFIVLHEPEFLKELSESSKYEELRRDCSDLAYVPYQGLKKEIDKLWLFFPNIPYGKERGEGTDAFKADFFSVLPISNATDNYERMVRLCRVLKTDVLDLFIDPENRKQMPNPVEILHALSLIEDNLSQFNQAYKNIKSPQEETHLRENAREISNIILQEISRNLYSFHSAAYKSGVTLKDITKDLFEALHLPVVDRAYQKIGKNGGVTDLIGEQVSDFGTVYFLLDIETIERDLQERLECSIPIVATRRISQNMPYTFHFQDPPTVKIDLKEGKISFTLGSVLLGEEFQKIPESHVSSQFNFTKLYDIVQAAYYGDELFVRETNGVRYSYDLEKLLEENPANSKISFAAPEFEDYTLAWNSCEHVNGNYERLILVTHKKTGYEFCITQNLERASSCVKKWNSRRKAQALALKEGDPNYIFARNMVNKSYKQARKYVKLGYSYKILVEKEMNLANRIAQKQDIDVKEYATEVVKVIYTSAQSSLKYGYRDLADTEINWANKIAQEQDIDVKPYVKPIVKLIFYEASENLKRTSMGSAETYFTFGLETAKKNSIDPREFARHTVQIAIEEAKKNVIGGYFSLAEGHLSLGKKFAQLARLEDLEVQIKDLTTNIKSWRE
ncbi:MAG: hypothetical protein Q8R18_04880, partial [bacterium]|nr:hypothetical protein [bacterium]